MKKKITKKKPVAKKEKKQKPVKSVDPIEAKLIADSIKLFEVVVPGDFASKGGPYARKPTREVVLALVKRVGFDELGSMVARYLLGAKDPFRPQVGTVYEFCTYKLAKIEAWLGRGGKLWAQKPVSDATAATERQAAFKAKLEREREAQRLKDENDRPYIEKWGIRP
jgi:hypothetical protein